MPFDKDEPATHMFKEGPKPCLLNSFDRSNVSCERINPNLFVIAEQAVGDPVER